MRQFAEKRTEVIAIHRGTGTGYVHVILGHGGYAAVTTVAGWTYNVPFSSIDLLPGAEIV